MLQVSLTKETAGVLKYYNYLQKNTDVYISPAIVDEEFIHFPRNIQKLEHCLNTKLTIIDQTVSKSVDKKIELCENFKLKEHQILPMNTINENFNKVCDQLLEGETGYGKTYCLPYTLAHLQQKTLVLVDRTLLAEQMFKEISTNCNADVQIIGKKTETIADVNIGTVQFFMKNPEVLRKMSENIGLVVLDECHICGAEKIKTVVQNLKAKYRLGLSATPTRSDGLTEILTDVFGNTKVIAEASGNLKPYVVRIKNTDLVFNVSSMAKYKKDMSKFLQQATLTKRVLITLKKALSTNRQVLIATDIVEVQEHYCNILNKIGVPAAIVNAKTPAAERQKILADFDSGFVKVLVSFAVLEKGISIPRLDTLIHLSGATSKEKLAQLLGRLRRADDRKQHPMFIDFQFSGNTYTANTTREDTYLNLYKENKIEKMILMPSFEAFENKL
jgi:superfamily II DNA or RNA helicase